MNLREEKLHLRLEVSKKRVENLLNDERIEAKFKQIRANKNVKKSSIELEKSIYELNEIIEELQCMWLKKISFEKAMKVAQFDYIVYIIGTMADAIIFDKKTIQDVVGDQINVEIFLKVISNLQTKIYVNMFAIESIEEYRFIINKSEKMKCIKHFFEMMEES